MIGFIGTYIQTRCCMVGLPSLFRSLLAFYVLERSIPPYVPYATFDYETDKNSDIVVMAAHDGKS